MCLYIYIRFVCVCLCIFTGGENNLYFHVPSLKCNTSRGMRLWREVRWEGESEWNGFVSKVNVLYCVCVLYILEFIKPIRSPPPHAYYLGRPVQHTAETTAASNLPKEFNNATTGDVLIYIYFLNCLYSLFPSRMFECFCFCLFHVSV